MDWVELDDVKLRYIKISQLASKYIYVDVIPNMLKVQISLQDSKLKLRLFTIPPNF